MGRRGVGELERAVMDVLWAASSPLSVRVVVERLGDQRLAYTTVMTVLDRLAAKKTVTRQRDGRAWLYRAAASKEEFIAGLMNEALDLAGDRSAVLTHFAHLVSDDDAGALRAALQDDSPPRYLIS